MKMVPWRKSKTVQTSLKTLVKRLRLLKIPESIIGSSIQQCVIFGERTSRSTTNLTTKKLISECSEKTPQSLQLGSRMTSLLSRNAFNTMSYIGRSKSSSKTQKTTMVWWITTRRISISLLALTNSCQPEEGIHSWISMISFGFPANPICLTRNFLKIL